MAVVSVRVDDQTLSLLRAHHVNISAIARDALEHEARRYRAIESLDRLKEWSAPKGHESGTRMIRRLRDER